MFGAKKARARWRGNLIISSGVGGVAGVEDGEDGEEREKAGGGRRRQKRTTPPVRIPDDVSSLGRMFYWGDIGSELRLDVDGTGVIPCACCRGLMGEGGGGAGTECE